MDNRWDSVRVGHLVVEQVLLGLMEAPVLVEVAADAEGAQAA